MLTNEFGVLPKVTLGQLSLVDQRIVAVIET